MLQELGHQDFGVLVHLQVGQGVRPFAGRVRARGLGLQVDVELLALLLLLSDRRMTVSDCSRA